MSLDVFTAYARRSRGGGLAIHLGSTFALSGLWFDVLVDGWLVASGKIDKQRIELSPGTISKFGIFPFTSIMGDRIYQIRLC